MSTQPNKKQYRYPGVTPFSIEQSHIFFGREKDASQLFKTIRRSPLLILYGKSGLGKSSLINAGLIPKYRKDNEYAPILIRYGAWTENARSPLESTKLAIQEGYKQDSFISELIPEEDSLWYWAKNRQLNDGGFPLLIFDQFEEIFSYPEETLIDFLRELAELLHTGIPLRFERRLEKEDVLSDDEEELLEEPLQTRVLIAIRSDRLHLLDRLKDYLPTVLRNTYELKALGIEDAKEAIVQPANMLGDFHSDPFTFSDAALDKLLNFLKDEESQRIEGILIQMLCEHYEQKTVIAQDIDHLDLKEIGEPGSVVSNYYEEKIESLLPEKRLVARQLIEEGLVSEGEGMRLSLHEAFILQKYRLEKSLLEELVEKRLLRSEPFLRGGYTYELSHDRLVPAVVDARTHRKAKEEEKRREEEARLLEERAEKERAEKERAKKQLRQTRGLLAAAILGLLLATAGMVYAINRTNVARASKKVTEELLKANVRMNETNRKEKLNRYMAEGRRLQSDGQFADAINKYEVAKEFAEDTAQINLVIEQCKLAEDNRATYAQLKLDAKRSREKEAYEEAIIFYEKALSLGLYKEALIADLRAFHAELTIKANEEHDKADVLDYKPDRAAIHRNAAKKFESYIRQIQTLITQ